MGFLANNKGAVKVRPHPTSEIMLNYRRKLIPDGVFTPITTYDRTFVQLPTSVCLYLNYSFRAVDNTWSIQSHSLHSGYIKFYGVEYNLSC